MCGEREVHIWGVFSWQEGLREAPPRPLNLNDDDEVLTRCLYLENHGDSEGAEDLLNFWELYRRRKERWEVK